jgi:hypothetical protein
MKKLFKTLASTSALSILVLLAACSDKSTPSPTPKTNQELIASTEWVRVTQTVSPSMQDEDGNVYTSYLELEDACERDNTVKYSADGTAIYAPGQMKCEGDEDELFSVVWRMNSNGTVLIEDGAEYEIVEISEDVLRLKTKVQGRELEQDPSKTYTMDITLEPVR